MFIFLDTESTGRKSLLRDFNFWLTPASQPRCIVLKIKKRKKIWSRMVVYEGSVFAPQNIHIFQWLVIAVISLLYPWLECHYFSSAEYSAHADRIAGHAEYMFVVFVVDILKINKLIKLFRLSHDKHLVTGMVISCLVACVPPAHQKGHLRSC